MHHLSTNLCEKLLRNPANKQINKHKRKITSFEVINEHCKAICKALCKKWKSSYIFMNCLSQFIHIGCHRRFIFLQPCEIFLQTFAGNFLLVDICLDLISTSFQHINLSLHWVTLVVKIQTPADTYTHTATSSGSVAKWFEIQTCDLQSVWNPGHRAAECNRR